MVPPQEAEVWLISVTDAVVNTGMAGSTGVGSSVFLEHPGRNNKKTTVIITIEWNNLCSFMREYFEVNKTKIQTNLSIIE
jgi:hypothetical protein